MCTWSDSELQTQAAAAYKVMDKRWRERLKQLAQDSGKTSLPPTWFTLREPDGLKGPRGSLPRYRCSAGLASSISSTVASDVRSRM